MCAHSHVNCRSQQNSDTTHRHTQTRTDTHRHTQTHTDTHTHTHTHKHIHNNTHPHPHTNNKHRHNLRVRPNFGTNKSLLKSTCMERPSAYTSIVLRIGGSKRRPHPSLLRLICYSSLNGARGISVSNNQPVNCLPPLQREDIQFADWQFQTETHQFLLHWICYSNLKGPRRGNLRFESPIRNSLSHFKMTKHAYVSGSDHQSANCLSPVKTTNAGGSTFRTVNQQITKRPSKRQRMGSSPFRTANPQIAYPPSTGPRRGGLRFEPPIRQLPTPLQRDHGERMSPFRSANQ